jgi:hypothetical protein
VSTDVNALQLLPESQNTTGLALGDGNDGLFVTCVDPTCIITYCPVPSTAIG